MASAETILRVARGLSAVSAEPGRVAAEVAEIICAENCADGILVAELDGLRFHVRGAAGALAVASGESFPSEGSLALSAMAGQRTLVHADPGALGLGAQVTARLQAQEVLIAPLLAGGVAVGVLVATRTVPGVFTDRDTVTLGRLAELASLAVHNAQLLERERLGMREATAVADIVHELNQSLELERVVALVTDRARALLGGRSAMLTVIEGDELAVAATSGSARPHVGERLSLFSSFTGAAIRAGRPLRLTEGSAETMDSLESTLDRTQRAIVAPLLVADRPIGGILVSGSTEREYTERDEELLRALASHGAIAIENSRLYRAAAHTARHAETLSRAAKSLSESVVPGGFFVELFRVASGLLGVDGLTVYSANPEQRVVRIVYAAGAGVAAIESLGGRVVDEEITERLLTGLEVFYPDIRRMDEAGTLPRALQLHATDIVAVARLPLIVEGRVQGALTLRWKSPRPFNDDDRILLRDFATQVSMALRTSDLIAHLERRAKRFSAVARMQQVISRVELHDVYDEVKNSTRTAMPQAQTIVLLAITDDRETFLPQVIVADDVVVWADELPDVPVAGCAASEAVSRATRVTTSAPMRSWPDYISGIAARRMRSEIAVPLMHGDVPAGVLIVQSEDLHAFSAEDGDVLALLARQAGTAIENARLFEAERRTREIAEAAAEISRAALASTGIEQTARRVLEMVDRVAPSSGKALALVEFKGEGLRYLAASGALSPLQHLVVPAGESATALATTATTPMAVTADRLAEIREGSVIPDGATLIPLIAKSRVLGVLWSIPSGGDANETLTGLAATLALAADVLLLDEEERQRREREQMLATAVATMQQPVLIVGLERRVIYANAAAADEYGFTVEEFLGVPLARTIDASVPARFIAPDGPEPATGPRAVEQLHRRKDGSKFPASVLLSTIRDESGMPVGQVVAVRNLTEEQRLQEQLRQTEKLAALGELVAGVAHELNNPLAGISAFAQLMMEDDLNEEHHESVRLIKREADRAVGVIRDLLTFSRKSGPSQKLIDLNAMVELTLRLRAYSLRSAGIDLHVHLEEDIPRVRGDDQRLQQVLLNLIVNAEYALQRSESKSLAVRTERTAGGVALFVTDSGAGMTEEVRQRIFEPFFTTKSAGEGTGLGLSVSYGIVHAHGGTISVESAPAMGTTFRIALPASATPLPV